VSPTYVVASDQCRRTPPWLYQACCSLAGVDDFALDAFADATNALCLHYLDGGPQRDGLVEPWSDWTFANPPFKLMDRVVGKALVEAVDYGRARSVLVGPAGCSQRWFRALGPRAHVWLPDRRLVFLDRDGRPTRGAMQDSAVYIVDGVPRERPEVDVLRVDEEST